MKILFAEDNLDVREYYHSLLIDVLPGVEIKEVDNGKNGVVELLEQNNNIDLVLADYFMPNGHGNLICEYLAQTESSIPFIYLTSKSYDEIAANTKGFPMRLGLDYYLRKTGNLKTFNYKMHDIFSSITKHYKKSGSFVTEGFTSMAQIYMNFIK